MKIRKWMMPSLITMLLLSAVVATPNVSASSLNELREEKTELEGKKKEVKSSIDSKESEISTNKNTIESITAQIKELTQKVNETNGKISEVEGEIAQTTEEITALQASIVELEEKIAERDIVLRERVRSIQVSGGSVSYLDVLLGANNFSDFIDRFSAVTTIVEADRNIMQQQADDQAQLEEEKILVEEKLAEQEENRAKLQNLKNSLESQKKEKDGLVQELEKKQQSLLVEKEDLEHLFSETEQMSQELEGQIVAEQKRIAEIARKAAEEKKRKEAAEAAARAAQAQSSNSASSSSSSNAGSSSSSSSGSTAGLAKPSVSSGSWTRPASGRLTSPFGWRTHPIHGTQRQHRGLDIANSIGTPIVAAGDGVVSRASGHATLGNHIMITHVVNGQTYTTLYAHLSGMNVSAGQTVSKGQSIGRMGNTGAVTGPHLHFEFHIGYFSGSGPSAVNPLGYVPF